MAVVRCKISDRFAGDFVLPDPVPADGAFSVFWSDETHQLVYVDGMLSGVLFDHTVYTDPIPPGPYMATEADMKSWGLIE